MSRVWIRMSVCVRVSYVEHVWKYVTTAHKPPFLRKALESFFQEPFCLIVHHTEVRRGKARQSSLICKASFVQKGRFKVPL